MGENAFLRGQNPKNCFFLLLTGGGGAGGGRASGDGGGGWENAPHAPLMPPLVRQSSRFFTHNKRPETMDQKYKTKDADF